MDVELDGTTILTVDDLHTELGALDFGPYYGRNLSALHDRPDYYVERPVRIVWRSHAVSKQPIDDDMFARIVRVFDSVVACDKAAGVEPSFSYALT